MILISHRGNLNGPNPERENSPSYIKEALDAGYYCEVDIHYNENGWFLGHDEPKCPIIMHEFVRQSKERVFFHVKTAATLRAISSFYPFVNYFWHQNDDYCLTSGKNILVHPDAFLDIGGIVMMPELRNNFHGLEKCHGICSDYVANLWRCRRCGGIVNMIVKRCGCTVSPSPWEPITNE